MTVVALVRGAFTCWRVNPDFSPFLTRGVFRTPARAFSL